MQGNNSCTSEGSSMIRPPYFDGNNYQYWKMRMKIFTSSLEADVWWIIENGPLKITKIENGATIEKPRTEWDEEDKKKYELNNKAINAIVCSLHADEFKKLSRCETAKEMWDKLQATYEGTSDMRNAKIDRLMHDYEIFKMKDTETIDEMFERFGVILNDLDSLGERLEQSRLVRKILRSLTSMWKPKITALEESNKIERMSIDDLRGNLLTYEATHLQDEVRNVKKSKGVALKAVDSDNDSEEESGNEDEDIAFLARKLKKMGLFRKRKFYRKPASEKPFSGKNMYRNETSKRRDEVTCFECKKPGHMRPECPLLKKQYKGKKKAMIAETWDDEDILAEEDSEEENEVANLCLMTKTDSEAEVTSNILSDLDIDELVKESAKVLECYYELKRKHKQTLNKHVDLEYENRDLLEKVATLEKENQKLKARSFLKEVNELKEKLVELETENLELKDIANVNQSKIVDEIKEMLAITVNEKYELQEVNKVLRKDLERLVGSSKNLDIMLGTQRGYYDKTGLGFNDDHQFIDLSKKDCKNRKTVFIPSRKNSCYICREKGHIAANCYHAKKKALPRHSVFTEIKNKIRNPFVTIKKIWVPKGSLNKSSTNLERTQEKLGT